MESHPRTRACRQALSLLAFLLLVAGPAAALNLGIPVNSGDSVTTAIEPAGDEDPMVFEASAGSTLTASVKRTKGSFLEPGFRLIDPAGNEVPIAGSLKSSPKSASLKKLVLSLTGRYALVVLGKNNGRGGYQVKLKLKPPKGAKMKGLSLGAGKTVDYRFGGVQDAILSLSIKIRGGGLSVVGLDDPKGTPVTGYAGPLKISTKSIKGKIFLTGPFGDFTLRLGDVTADATYHISMKVKFPKLPKGKKTVSSEEPSITDLFASVSGLPFGDEGSNITIEGANFATFPQVPTVYFGENVVGPTDYLQKLATRLVVRAPVGDGLVDVTIVNPDGNLATAKDAFTFVGDAPADLVLSNDRSGVNGGMLVTISGNNLNFFRKVTVGNALVALEPGETLTAEEQAQFPVAVVTNTLGKIVDGEGRVTALTFTTAAVDVTRSGHHVLTVWDLFGQQSAPRDFEYVAPPDIDAVDPAGGSKGGGTTVTIYGPEAVRDWSAIYFDGALLSTTSVGDDGHRFTTVPHALGLVDLRVVDVFGQESTLSDAYQFNEGSWLDVTTTSIPKDDVRSMKRGDDIAIGDVNDDGHLDIVIGRDAPNGNERLLKLLLGDGNGKFTDGTFVGLPAPNEAAKAGDNHNSRAVALGDLDGDGDLDLVFSSTKIFSYAKKIGYSTNPRIDAMGRIYPSTRIFLNDGKGKFSDVTLTALPSVRTHGADPFQASTLTLGDVDKDNDLDIIMSLYKQPARTYNLEYYTGNNWYPSKRRLKPVYPPFSNGTVAPIPLASATRVLVNDGKAKFTNKSGTNMPAGTSGDILVGHQVLLEDLDKDGDKDMVVTVENPDTRNTQKREYINDLKTGSRSETRILENDGTGKFTNKTSTWMPKTKTWDQWGGRGIAYGDLDGDTYGDLVITTDRDLYFKNPLNVYAVRTRVLLGDSKGVFTEATGKLPAVRTDGQGDMYDGVAIILTDLDGDGKRDLVLTTTTQIIGQDPRTGDFDTKLSSTRILKNSGSGILTDETSRHLPNPTYSGDAFRAHAVILGDVDEDKSLDLILTTSLPVAHPTRVLMFR